MLHLYYRPTCPFCLRVLYTAETYGINLDLKNISSNPDALDELLTKGGKQQVPFLVDESKDKSMYESSDIIAYLEEHYT